MIFRSHLAATPDEVWAWASAPAGICAELWPVHMHLPPGPLGPGHAGQPPVAVTLSLFGLVPFDLHRLALAEVTPGQGFQERSTSLLHRRWDHRRTISPAEGGCVIEDEVDVTPRLPIAALVHAVVAAVFRRRHAVLRARFGVVG